MRLLPSILSGDGVSIGRIVDEADVDSDQRCSVGGHHLSTDDTSMAAWERDRPTDVLSWNI